MLNVMGIFRRFEGLSESEEKLHAQEVRVWVGSVPGVEQIAECRPRTRVKVAGLVESIKVVPSDTCPRLEIQIFDGTDQITGVWIGRRHIEGIDLGQGVVLEGTMQRSSKDILEIINPAYELLPPQPATPA